MIMMTIKPSNRWLPKKAVHLVDPFRKDTHTNAYEYIYVYINNKDLIRYFVWPQLIWKSSIPRMKKATEAAILIWINHLDTNRISYKLTVRV